MKKITSESNSLFKRWKKLHTRKGRNEYRSFLIEGKTLIKEAYTSGLQLQAIVFNAEEKACFEEASTYGVPLYELTKPLFSKVIQTETPQGIFGIVSMPLVSIEEILHQGKYTRLLLVDAIQDPGNMGTLIRTSDAAGVDGIFLGHGTVDVYNPKVVRSAMGSIFRLPILQCDLKQIISALKANNVTIIGTSPRAEKDIFHYSFPNRTALLLGNEGNGVQPLFGEFIDEEVKVPMPGSTESLNVAITGAIVLYEQIRQNVGK